MTHKFKFGNQSLHHVGSGFLSKSGEKFDVVELNKSHIDQILKLQDQTYKTLKPDERTYIIPKDRAYLERHFDTGNEILGVIVDNKLIAQSILQYPNQTITEKDMVKIPDNVDHTKASIMQGVIVDPDFRGHHLMQIMIDHWIEHAETKGRTDLLATIDTANIASWSSFMRGGMNLYFTGIDPNDGGKIYNAHEKVQNIALKKSDLSCLFNLAAKKKGAMRACHINQVKKQAKLFDKGYVCTSFSKHCGTLTFIEPKTFQKWQDQHHKPEHHGIKK